MIGKVAGTNDLPGRTRVARQCERTDHRLQPGKGFPGRCFDAVSKHVLRRAAAAGLPWAGFGHGRDVANETGECLRDMRQATNARRSGDAACRRNP